MLGCYALPWFLRYQNVINQRGPSICVFHNGQCVIRNSSIRDLFRLFSTPSCKLCSFSHLYHQMSVSLSLTVYPSLHCSALLQCKLAKTKVTITLKERFGGKTATERDVNVDLAKLSVPQWSVVFSDVYLDHSQEILIRVVVPEIVLVSAVPLKEDVETIETMSFPVVAVTLPSWQVECMFESVCSQNTVKRETVSFRKMRGIDKNL